jgi:DNA-binding transcriptional LysR family regulator
MHIRQLDLNLFAVFEAIHGEGSVTRAGQKLNLTQPAISHGLRRLRVLLKDELFIRHGNRMIPTPLSRSIIHDVRSALHLLEMSTQETGFDPSRSSRLFHVGMRNVLQPSILPRLMGRVSQAAPGVSLSCLRIDRGNLELDLASGAVDLAIDIAMPLSDSIAQQQLSAWEFVVVSRKGHPAFNGQHLNLRTYLSLPHVLVSGRRAGTTLVDIELRSRGAKRTIVLRCPDPFTACRVVSQTDLVVTMPDCYADAANAGLNNQIHRFPVKTAKYGEYMYWHTSAESDPEIRWLRDQVLSLFGATPPRDNARHS